MKHSNRQVTNTHVNVIISMIFLAVMTRLIPHPWHVTAVSAVALFGGAWLRDWRLALLVPLLAFWISDLVLNNLVYQQFYAGGITLWHADFVWTGTAMVLTVLLGRAWLSARRGVMRVAGASVTASTLFFVISNFGVWASGVLYPLTFAGLVACYTAALPFYGQQLIGDLAWCGVLFGGFALLQKRLSHRLQHA